MAAKVGRLDVFTWGGTRIDGVRSKGLAINGEPIDITSDDDSGFRTLADESGQDQIDFSISGVVKDRKLIEDFMSGARTKEVEFTFAKSGGTLTGDFRIVSLTETGEYNGAPTFDAELQSTGAYSYVAAAAPTNLVPPAIAGTPQVGVELFAFPGVWSGNPSFTYQWNNGGSPLAGATSQKYTPISTDEGDVLTVTVTATNTAGTASETSGPAADVLAA